MCLTSRTGSRQLDRRQPTPCLRRAQCRRRRRPQALRLSVSRPKPSHRGGRLVNCYVEQPIKPSFVHPPSTSSCSLGRLPRLRDARRTFCSVQAAPSRCGAAIATTIAGAGPKTSLRWPCPLCDLRLDRIGDVGLRRASSRERVHRCAENTARDCAAQRQTRPITLVRWS